MNTSNKLDLTKYILSSLTTWYKEEMGHDENDLSILKTLKLIFLLSTIDSNKSDNLGSLGFTNYKAMPLGPVEVDVYNFFKRDLKDVINTRSTKTEILVEPTIDCANKELLDKLINQLKIKNKKLILYSASSLVDLTHKYASWIINFNKAKSIGSLSYKIDVNLLHSEEKFYYL